MQLKIVLYLLCDNFYESKKPTHDGIYSIHKNHFLFTFFT